MDSIRETYSKVGERIRHDYNKRMLQLNSLERMWRILTELDDTELRIFMKNPYYNGRKDRGSWPLTNFSEYPEMKADPVFSKLNRLWDKMFEIDEFVDVGLESEHKLKPIYDCLCCVATKMANREMSKQEYTSLSNNTHVLFELAKNLMPLSLEKSVR